MFTLSPRLTVIGGSLEIRSLLGSKTVELGDIRVVRLVSVSRRPRSPLVPIILVEAADGRLVARLSGLFWSEDKLRSMFEAAGVPVEGSWEDEIDAVDLKERYAEGVTWRERHPEAYSALAIGVGLLVVIAIVVLTALHVLPEA
jgi:hypothetical protein